MKAYNIKLSKFKVLISYTCSGAANDPKFPYSSEIMQGE